jgi:hypothetical protein
MLLFEDGSVESKLDAAQMKRGLFEALDKLGKRKNVLIVPPDFTRFHSRAGLLTQFACITVMH